MMQNARSLFGLWILVGACSSPEGDTELRALPFDLEESGAVILSEEEGLEEYISLVSEAKGWSRAEALLHSQEAEAMARIVDRLLSIDPDRYVGGAISPKPGGIARLYIKGPLDELIRDLVGSESMAVEVVPNQPFSSREIEARGEELLIALRDAGLRDASLGTDITRPGHFDLTLRRQSSFTEAQSVLEAIPEKFRDDVSVTLQDEPVVRLQAAGGGLRMRQGSAFQCTSGFTVTRTDGQRAITTAGHCVGLTSMPDDLFETYNLALFNQHIGSYGDVEAHQAISPYGGLLTNQIKTSGTIKSITSVQSRSGMLNHTVSGFGRATNATVTATVLQESTLLMLEDGTVLNRMVRLNVSPFDFGDSGGPWFVNNKAYGVHFGDASFGGVRQALFSAASEFPNALNASVRTTP